MSVPLLVDGVIDSYVEARHKWWRGNVDLMYFGLHVPVWPERSDGAEGVARYFATTPRVASTHFAGDNDSVVRCAPDQYRCASMVGANQLGVHFEIVGYADQTVEQWADDFSTAALRRAANVAILYRDEYGIEPVILSQREMRAGKKKGSIKHSDAVDVWGGDFRSDPGQNFPDEFWMALVRGEESTTTGDDDVIPFDQWRKTYNQADPGTPDGIVEMVQLFLQGRGHYGTTRSIDGMRGPITDAAWVGFERVIGGDEDAHAGNKAWDAMWATMLSEGHADCSEPEAKIAAALAALKA